MIEEVIIADGTPEYGRTLAEFLKREHYHARIFNTLDSLEAFSPTTRCSALIIDLDSLPVDKKFFRNFKQKHPSLCILGISSQAFHPELKEAMRQHIFACLKKPVDLDELSFLLRSINDRADRDL